MVSPSHSTGVRLPVAQLLQKLIRFDTTNPPGNESECATYCRDVLADAGIPADLMGDDPDRLNVVSRLPGRGDAPPLLLYGHIDVVPTASNPGTSRPSRAASRTTTSGVAARWT